MSVQMRDISSLEALCLSSIEAGIAKLCEIGTWPRPPAARRLRPGHDFYQADLQGLEPVSRFLQHLAAQQDIKSIYLSSADLSYYSLLYPLWEALLLKVLSETEGMSPTKPVWRKWFSRFIKELYSDTAVWRTVDTVSGLVIPHGELHFDKFTKLVPLHLSQWGRITMNQEWDFRGSWTGILSDEAAIITTVTLRKRDYAAMSMPPDHLVRSIDRSQAVMDTIRLCIPGVPRLSGHAMIHLSLFPLCEPLGYEHRDGMTTMYEKGTVIERRDFREIRNYWRELMASRYKTSGPRTAEPNALDMASARFFRTYGPLRNWLDEVVDLTIALESLFNPKDTEELKYRVSLRAAWLLDVSMREDTSTSKSSRVYECVRTMYEIRSRRVHGGGAPKDADRRRWITILSGVEYDSAKESEQIELALETARDIVRRAISACTTLSKLKDSGPRWPFPDDFDENLLSPGQRKEWQKAAGIKRRHSAYRGASVAYC